MTSGAARRRIFGDERGLSSTEHVVLFSLVCIGAICAWKGVSGSLSSQVTTGTNTFNTRMQSALHRSEPSGAAPGESGSIQAVFGHGTASSDPAAVPAANGGGSIQAVYGHGSAVEDPSAPASSRGARKQAAPNPASAARPATAAAPGSSAAYGSTPAANGGGTELAGAAEAAADGVAADGQPEQDMVLDDEGASDGKMSHCAKPKMNKNGRWYCERQSVLPGKPK